MRNDFEVTEYNILTYKPIDPISIAVVADLHGRPYESVLERLNIRKPDVIAVVGDVIEGDCEQFPLSFFSSCVGIAPTHFSLGNHERKITEDEIQNIEDTGTVVLDNGWCECRDAILFGGMTSPFVTEWRDTYQIKLRYALPDYSWLNEFENQKGFKVLLDHHPENFQSVTRDRDIDLVLSGHAHVGQIRIFGQGLYAPHQGFFPKYTSGVYENRLVISRGLFNPKPIPRIGNPKEIIIVNISNEGSNLG